MTQFEILTDVLDLWTAGRKNAAAAQWKSLQKDFQVRVIDYTLHILERPEEIPKTSLVTLRSAKFGIFYCSPSTLRQLVQVVPALVT